MTSKLELNRIYNMDCIDGVKQLEDSMIDCIVTDPPYCSGGRQTSTMTSKKSMRRAERWEIEWFGTDNMSTIGFLNFMRALEMLLLNKSKIGAHQYIFIDWRNYPLLSNILETAGWRLNNMIVWDKKHIGMGNGYRNRHELIILASKGSPRDYNRKDLPNLFKMRKPLDDDHPTQKPEDLIKVFIENSTKFGDVVLDPFMGSGTTAIASKKMAREYIGFELNLDYCISAEHKLKNIIRPDVEMVRVQQPKKAKLEEFIG